MTTTSVFLLGATGYIGGPVAQRLLALGYRLTVLVRSDDARAQALRDAGAAVVVGSLDATELIQSQAASADAVVTAASTSHLPSVQAILAGFAARRAKSGAVGVLIHTSGTGIFATGDARGLAPSPTDAPFSDLDVGRIERLGDSHPQRKVHLAIVAAASKGDVRSAIVLPSTIFGRSAERGAGRVFNGHSNQMPALIRASIKRGRAGLVGKYENTWPLVHTDDLTDLFQLALEAVLHGNAAGTGRDGFYVAENGRYVGRDAAARVGEALRARGLAQTAEPSAFSADELKVGWGAYSDFAGTNSQALGDRSRALGWRARHTHADFLASLDAEAASIYAEEFEGRA